MRVRNNRPTIKVTQKAMVPERESGMLREVDVLFVEDGHRLGIDVKAEKHPLTIEMVEQLCAKGAKLLLDEYALVSTSGYTKSAAREAASHHVHLQTLEEFTTSKWYVGPPLMTVVRNEHAFIAGRIEYPVGQDVGLPSDLKLAEIIVEYSDGTLSPMNKVLAVETGRAFPHDKPMPAEGGIQEILLMVTDTWRCLRTPSGVLPLPQQIRFAVRWHQVIEQVPQSRFRTMDGVESFSIITTVEGEEGQVSLVMSPQGESMALSAVAVPARPKRVKAE